jgi:hypothetical protein
MGMSGAEGKSGLVQNSTSTHIDILLRELALELRFDSS